MRIWIPSVTMMLVSLISYVDRNTLALLSPTILKETGMSVEEYGWIISAFSILYMISNPVWGTILDKVGLRLGMTLSVGFWTMASAAHAFAAGFWSFAGARAALGFGEGATFPGGLRAAVQSLPPHLRSRGIAISYSGGSLGAIVTPIIVTPIAAAFGWRGAFWFTGLAGVSWLAVWYFVGRRDDMRHGFLDERPKIAIRWSDAKVWSFMAAYAFGGFPLAFVLYQSAIYLNRELHATQLEVGKVLWIPPLGWEIGYFLWGWTTDRSLRAARDPMSAYRWLMGVALAFSLPLALLTSHQSYGLVLFQLFWAMFAAAGYVVCPISYATHVFSSSHAGLIAGLGAGSWGAVVALAMPWFGRLFDQHRYAEAFAFATLFPVVGYTIWMYINREVKTA